MQAQQADHKHKQIAMMLEKMAVKDLAGRGSAGDDHIAHVGTNDIVFPQERISPRVRKQLSEIAREAGIDDLDRFVVGNSKNSKNKDTGLPEFADSGGGDVGGVGGGDSPGPSPGGEHDAAKEAAAPGGNTFGGVSGTNAGFGGNTGVGSAGQFGATGGLTAAGTTDASSPLSGQGGISGMIGSGLANLGVNVNTGSQGTQIGFDPSQLGNTALSSVANLAVSGIPVLGQANALANIANMFGAELPTAGGLATSGLSALSADAANNPNGPGTQGTNPGERGGQPGIDRILTPPSATPPVTAPSSPAAAATLPQAPSAAQPAIATAPNRLPSGPTVSDTTGNQANLATYLRDIGLGWFR